MHSYSPNHAPSLDRLQCRLQPPARSFSRPLPPRSQGHCRVACGLGNTLPSIRMGVSCFSCTLASSPSRGYWSSALAIHGCGLADAITSCVFCSNAANFIMFGSMFPKKMCEWIAMLMVMSMCLGLAGIGALVFTKSCSLA